MAAHAVRAVQRSTDLPTPDRQRALRLSPDDAPQDVIEEGMPMRPSEWGWTQVDYLGHKVSKRGFRVNPKNLELLTALEFPRTLKGLQSFLGSLNYYHRFISDFAVYASTLYALTEPNFEAYDVSQEAQRQEKWRHAICAFEALKVKLAETPMLKHVHPYREPIVIVYASKWAVAAVLAQVHACRSSSPAER
ncbi:unnamed protein product [Phytophthora fragariaefolia]|uniref:Unnamed protein product n=1 Tax=Phytophthora fragariaefolia TaxID=1490495 RepID=A0A9W7D0U7_9STRA|nr:unnamed protein product [Phytophthora fragariaefolia]